MKPALDPIDELNQILAELRVVWLALGNRDYAADHVLQIGEHVHGIAKRVDAVCRRMEGGAA